MTQLSNRAELHRSIASKVADLRKRQYSTIAVICKSAVESAAAYDSLSGIEKIKLVKNGSIEYEQGVVVIPAYLAKGIEFDAVIIYDASAEVTEMRACVDCFTLPAPGLCITCNYTV